MNTAAWTSITFKRNLIQASGSKVCFAHPDLAPLDQMYRALSGAWVESGFEIGFLES